uniref:DDE Tnp4 domain-containing protein n=1 Tax=Sinocyclocheilus rhinocerous TaxID=307959 RepID=A0A673IZ77_9TELE
CTVSKIIPEVCKAIWDTLQPEFSPFPSQTQWMHIHTCHHQSPPECWNYFNYKGSHSVVLMAACDAHYRFTVVDVGAYGRESDGGVFKESIYGCKLINGTLELPRPVTLPGSDVTNPHVFVADTAFPLLPNLMHPFPGKVFCLSECTKEIIENTFGIMASRWRIFARPIDCSPDNVVHIVKACVALHNCLTHTDASNPGNTIQYRTPYQIAPPQTKTSSQVSGGGMWQATPIFLSDRLKYLSSGSPKRT